MQREKMWLQRLMRNRHCKKEQATCGLISIITVSCGAKHFLGATCFIGKASSVFPKSLYSYLLSSPFYRRGKEVSELASDESKITQLLPDGAAVGTYCKKTCSFHSAGQHQVCHRRMGRSHLQILEREQVRGMTVTCLQESSFGGVWEVGARLQRLMEGLDGEQHRPVSLARKKPDHGMRQVSPVRAFLFSLFCCCWCFKLVRAHNLWGKESKKETLRTRESKK